MRSLTPPWLAGLVLVPVLILSALATPAAATDRFFRDLSVTSPGAYWRLEAKSPDNADGQRRPFQRNFTYTLTDTRTQKPAWTRKQTANEASPVAAWVNDEGWAVIRTGWDELMVFEPAAGRQTGSVKILEQFPADESAQYVHQTTAGPMWAQSALWYFADIDGAAHFVVRAWWGRRILVELDTGKVTRDAGPAHDAALAAERADIVATLRRAAEGGEPPVDPKTGEHQDHELMRDVMTAAHYAGREGVREAIPFLKLLEPWSYVGSWSTVPMFLDKPLPEGSVDPFSWGEFTLRFKVQTALRRLDATPAGLPATFFSIESHDRAQRDRVEMVLDRPRADRAGRVKPGMSPLEVLEAVNAPDAVVSVERTRAWEYDMDDAEPYTLRVVWTTDNPPTVSEVKRLPPQWREGAIRDDD